KRESLTTCALVMIRPPSTTNPLPVTCRTDPPLHGVYQLGRCSWLTMRTTDRSIDGAAASDAEIPRHTSIAAKNGVSLLNVRLLVGVRTRESRHCRRLSLCLIIALDV